MIDYGRQRSTVKPDPVEITDTKIFTYSNITEVNEEGFDDQLGFVGYEFDFVEYSKDEYLNLLLTQTK